MANRLQLTFSDMADMHLMLGKCNGNASLAERRWAENFPNKPHPKRRFFVNLDRRLRETGTFLEQRSGQCGRPVNNVNQEDQILEIIDESPSTSTRVIAQQIGNSNHMKVHRTLKRQLLHPYHIQRVQTLLPQDYASRLHFCNWLLRKNNADAGFVGKILFTDEATFTRNGLTNVHNSHVWTDVNPHATVESHHQYTFKVNVWAGIVDNFLLGPVFLPTNLDSASFLNFLQNDFFYLLDNLPLVVRQNMWMQLDGAPPHFGLNVKQHLNLIFPNRWIGRGRDAPIQWPPRSPDFNPLDFSVWGFMKDHVYSEHIDNIDQLKRRIINAAEKFRRKPQVFQNIRFSVIKRVRLSIAEAGGHVEQLLN